MSMMKIDEFKRTHSIVGNSKEINDIVATVMQVASSDISILIYGESGSGKEVFARALHAASKRAGKPLISVNCGAIPEGLLESELFGHKKGSFTGAIDNRKGYFELADNGTLFLDEIAEMPLTTQVKLLRAIELKEFMQVGAEIVTHVDVRYIAATNKDLQHEVMSKRFRQDLYYRLKAVTLYVPPLRERKQDIKDLCDYFLGEFSIRNNTQNYTITSEAMDALITYNWPGNVRELKNTIETAAALVRNFTIDYSTILSLIQPYNGSANRNLPVSLGKTPTDLDREIILRALFELKRDIIELKEIVADRLESPKNVRVEEVQSIESLEKEAIVRALSRTNGNKRSTARLLGISERTLYRKIKEYDLPL